LASLWQVPEPKTALLMNTFYGELAKGRSQAEALRQAQLQRIAARRETFGAAHPFFWSAFALTSRGTE
jgi:CHAT domain-containing protein